MYYTMLMEGVEHMLTEKEIGKRMRDARMKSGLTLQEVADRVGVTNSTIFRYEQGDIRKIKLPVIESIAKALSVSPTWLLGKSDNMADLMSYLSESSTSGRTAAKEEMYRTFGVDHQAADLRLLGEKTAVLYYKAMERHSAPALVDIVTAVEDLSPEELEMTRVAVRAYLRADAPIREIVDTALKPYREEHPESELRKPSLDDQISAARKKTGSTSSNSSGGPGSRHPGGKEYPTYKSSHEQERE